MIQARELRIGNLVFIHDEVDSICEIGQANNGYCNNNGYFNFDKGAIEPIPLTKELLLKCGFEDTTGGWGGSQGCDYYYKKGNFEIQTYDSDIFWHLKGAFEIKIKYLHQLQNLYFALKNEELTIKF